MKSLLLLLVAISSAWTACPNNWIEISGLACIYPGVTKLTFPQLKVACHSVGGVPAKITNSFVNTIIQQNAQYTYAMNLTWIGVEQVVGEDYWAYADDIHTNLTFTKWAPGEPDSTYYCAAMNATDQGNWLARDCSEALPYFCSRDPLPDVSTTPGPSIGPVSCDDGWQAFGAYCYYLHNFTMLGDGQHWDLFNFTDAETICETMNSTLASIHSDAENQFIYNLAVSNVGDQDDPSYGHPCDWSPAWIGMMHTPDPNGTHWVDGTPVDFCDYPDGCIIAEMYNCGFLVHNDASCFPTDPARWFWWVIRAHYARFICKKPAMTTNADGFLHIEGYQ